MTQENVEPADEFGDEFGDDEVPEAIPSRRHAAPIVTLREEIVAPWFETVTMIGVGMLLAAGLLSLGFGFNSAVQRMDKPGVVVTIVAALMGLSFAAAAAGARRACNKRSALLNIGLLTATVLNWCAWTFGISILQLLQ